MDPPLPFDIWSHRLSPYGIFCRHVDRLTFKDVELVWSKPERAEWGSAIRCRFVNDLDLDGFKGRQALDSRAPAVHLHNVKNAFVRNCLAAKDCGTFLHLDEGTQHVTAIANDLSNCLTPTSMSAGVRKDELFQAANRTSRRK